MCVINQTTLPFYFQRNGIFIHYDKDLRSWATNFDRPPKRKHTMISQHVADVLASLTNPPDRFLLTMRDVRNILLHKQEIKVIEPQSFNKVTTLSCSHEMLFNCKYAELEVNENGDTEIGSFYGEKFALSGGGDYWFKYSPELIKWASKQKV